MTPINWKHLSDVIDYHVSNNGVQYIDTPWIVPKEVRNLTYDGKDFNVLQTSMCLVGSAEQGFLYGQLNDTLEIGETYISCTPCFRNEEEITDEHRAYFMKAELFKPLPIQSVTYGKEEVQNLAKLAKRALERLFNLYNIKVVKVNDFAVDLMLNGFEIGSYYYRVLKSNNSKFVSCDTFYVCGTAIAEPRFTYSMYNSKI